ncbi:GDSL-type esterase/lipase family protein [Rhodococcus sp. MEB064]|uniref:GDSL-type esterase/lipase family protein n=1 Tax=Rhodococcus sp. MEB064 TaxID=1587522 RepID=UPI0005ACF7DB|nr:GDSL-type esterase/lipase family protein [Rhodococcus sp. MEB064]
MIAAPLTDDLVLGAAELEQVERGVRPHRLPSAVRQRDADPQLAMMEAQPSGVRIATRTTAVEMVVEVHTTRMTYRGVKRDRGAVDVVIDNSVHQSHVLSGGDTIEIDPTTGTSTVHPGTTESITLTDLPAGEKTIEIWLPHNEQVDLVSLSADAVLHPAPTSGPRWLHHGSSISQGSNAASPTRIWPVVAARRAGVRVRNLGFGGSALVDPFMARVVRDSPADVISVKLGINVVNLDAMRLRSFVPAVHGFLDTVRDGHPTTPLLLISPIHCAIHENTPGPGAFDPEAFAAGSVRFRATGTEGDTAFGRLTLHVIRDALAQIVESRSDDSNLHYLDGRVLFGEDDERRNPLPDRLHPDTDAHALMGQRFANTVFGPSGPFAPRTTTEDVPDQSSRG